MSRYRRGPRPADCECTDMFTCGACLRRAGPTLSDEPPCESRFYGDPDGRCAIITGPSQPSGMFMVTRRDTRALPQPRERADTFEDALGIALAWTAVRAPD